jgi:hypothetical protein
MKISSVKLATSETGQQNRIGALQTAQQVDQGRERSAKR